MFNANSLPDRFSARLYLAILPIFNAKLIEFSHQSQMEQWQWLSCGSKRFI